MESIFFQLKKEVADQIQQSKNGIAYTEKSIRTLNQYLIEQERLLMTVREAKNLAEFSIKQTTECLNKIRAIDPDATQKGEEDFWKAMKEATQANPHVS